MKSSNAEAAPTPCEDVGTSLQEGLRDQIDWQWLQVCCCFILAGLQMQSRARLHARLRFRQANAARLALPWMQYGAVCSRKQAARTGGAL